MAKSERDLEMTDFKHCLEKIRQNDTNYVERYQLVYEAVELALELGYEAGIRIDPKEPKWPVAYIELPTGQVSWHMPEHTKPYDGHSTKEKYERIEQFIEEW
ncbi:hypothetical protein [Bacillus phage YungSlug]|nr:hypothetical protein [Bacillus phage YungSlug]